MHDESEPQRVAARRDTAPASPAARPIPSPALSREVVNGMHEAWDALKPGLLESLYEAGLARVLRDRGLFVQRQQPLEVPFRGEVIGVFRADLVVENQIIIELKVVEKLLPVHEAQVINYLRCSKLRLGFLANFSRRLQTRRFVV